MEENITFEEVKNEELEEVTSEEPEESLDGFIGKIICGSAIALAGIGALLYKNRAKLEERKIEKLRKKGYVIYKADETEECVSEVVDNENE